MLGHTRPHHPAFGKHAAHHVQRNARDAFGAAHVAAHQRIHGAAMLGKTAFGQGDDQVLAPLRVEDFVFLRAVVDQPLAAARMGLAPFLADAGRALPGGNDLEEVRAVTGHAGRGTPHTVAAGLYLGHPHGTQLKGVQTRRELLVVIDIAFQPIQRRHPVLPCTNGLLALHLCRLISGGGLGHAGSSVVNTLSLFVTGCFIIHSSLHTSFSRPAPHREIGVYPEAPARPDKTLCTPRQTPAALFSYDG